MPFFIILFALTFVLLMGKILQLMDLMVNKGVSFFDISKLILFLMPSLLTFTIPISLLVSILIGVGRLSSDNELTAMKAAGISLYRFLYPIGFSSIMAFLVTLIVSLFLVPYGNAATRDLLFSIIKQKASIGIKEKVFNDDFKGILLYAEKIPVDGNFLEGVMVSDNRISKETNTIIAKKAYLLSDPNSLTITLRLEDGSAHAVDKNLRNYRKMDFSSYDVNLALESSIAQEEKISKKDSTEMTIREIANTMMRSGISDIALRELAIELNKKISIPFSCIIFGILGIPLGIRAQRSVKSRGFSVGLLTVLIYYVLQIGVEAFAEAGKFSPFIGIWMPNFIFFIAAIYFFTMASKEKSFMPKWLIYRRKTIC